MQKKLGPAWTERGGRPPAGYVTKKMANEWLQDTLAEARRGTLPGMLRTGATFADAAAEYLRYIEQDRGRKPSTIQGYRSAISTHLLPAFGEMALEDVSTAAIERWIAGYQGSARMKNKLLIELHGILRRARKVWGLKENAAAEVEKVPQRTSGDIDVFSPEEVWALVRAAVTSQDAALYLTAAFTGLRMGELLALRWRDVDFSGSTVRVRSSYYNGALTTPKSGKVRAIPLAPDVADALAELKQRDLWVGDDDLVFSSETGNYLDGSALRRRYKKALSAAGLRSLRFHDLRHTFGTRMIAHADISGGRTSPFFFWGGTMRRVTITGTVGGVIWNPPKGIWKRSPEALAQSKAAERYYGSVDDWALDVSEARFRSVPTLRFGPPGRLIRRDPDTQPLITIRAAQRVLDLKPADIGVWRIVLEGLIKAGWPDEIVLMPALGARKAQREKELAGLERLRQVGAFEEDPPD